MSTVRIALANLEWSFGGFTVCDGMDPDGNVLQFREPTR